MIAENGRIEGIPALKEGDFDKALSASLGREIRRGRPGREPSRAPTEIRNAADEAAIFVNRLPELLEDMLEDAGRHRPEHVGVEVRHASTRAERS